MKEVSLNILNIFKHLGPPGLLENVKGFICDFLKLKEIEGDILPDTALSPPSTFQHPQDTLRYSLITPDIL